jgi:long-subunit acyl-CoA synthetase (AMP-forming)
MRNFTDSVGVNFDENEVFLSFLPLAHIFDRWVLLLYSTSTYAVSIVEEEIRRMNLREERERD